MLQYLFTHLPDPCRHHGLCDLRFARIRPTLLATRLCRNPLRSLFRKSKADSVIAEVVNRIPLPQEGVAENDQRAGGFGNVWECKSE